MQKTLDYGFNGYRIPAMPRASRSARGNRFYKKKASDNKMYAFEILASVAGDLLCENATFPSNYDSSVGRPRESVKQVEDSEDQYMQTAQLPLVGLGRSVSVSKDFIKQEVQDEVKPYKIEVCDQGSSDEGPSNYRSGLCQRISHARQRTVMEQPDPRNDGASRSVSLITKCDSSLQTPYVCQSIAEVRRNSSRGSGETCKNCKPETDLVLGKFDESKVCPDSTGSCQWKTDNTSRGCQERNEGKIKRPEKDTTLDIFNSEEPLDLLTKPPPLVSSDSSDEVAFCIRHPPCNELPIFQEDVKIVGKDDDENSFRSSQPSNVFLKGYYPANHGDMKFRKLFSSRMWKVTPTLVKDEKPHDEDAETGPTCYSRNTNYKRQRTQRCPAAKRRRLFQHSPISISERGGIDIVDVSNSPVKCILEAAPDPTSSANQVKLSIKSFKVPELLIEMPESATIGALKGTVMEAVTSILSSGLQVGILLQGKRIHDDTKTLIQAGISTDGGLEDVGFMLETDTLHPPKTSPTDPCPPLSPEKTEPLKRYNPLSENSDLGDEPAATGTLQADTITCGESECDQISSAADLSVKTLNLNPQALISIPTVSMEPLAVVPLHCKPPRSELVQRRMRRPFSVSEVEALVKAVEKLGTGRWRDIKLLAFDNAKHRTYVDLKDKWKTLVHTARISPQQRRGEPVPQELLDRVLAAHAHWSQQQAKHQAKQPAEAAARLLL